MILVIMGVAGSGKTTVGKLLAATLNWEFVEGDNFHSHSNLQKMKQGIALQDQDRLTWLYALKHEIEQRVQKNANAVFTCSALKESYRRILTVTSEVQFVYLKMEEKDIQKRILQREGHFFNPHLVQSQFTDLEEPQNALTLDGGLPREKLVQEMGHYFGLLH